METTVRCLVVRVVLLVVALCGPTVAWGVSEVDEPAKRASGSAEYDDSKKFDSPRATMFTFLAAINRVNDGYDDAWPQALACLDLSQADLASGKDLAQKLLEIFGRLGEITEDELPS